MKQLILIFLLSLSINAYAQDDKTVTLVASGQGKTQDEAKQNALRSAIEQAFGTFISSKTEILNDKLVKDEIVSIANGNVQNFNIISEVQIPNGSYSMTLKVKVSLNKMANFIQSKGFNITYNGNMMAQNLKQQNLNEQNEIKTIENVNFICKKIMDKSWNYKIISLPPKLNEENKYDIKISVGASFNDNINNFNSYLVNSLMGLSMPREEVYNYTQFGKKAYKVHLRNQVKHKLMTVEKFKEFASQFEDPKDSYLSGFNYDIKRNNQIVYSSHNIEKLDKKLDKYLEQYGKENISIEYYHKFANEYIVINLRSKESVNKLIDLIFYVKESPLKFKIDYGFSSIYGTSYLTDQNDYRNNDEDKFQLIGRKQFLPIEDDVSKNSLWQSEARAARSVQNIFEYKYPRNEQFDYFGLSIYNRDGRFDTVTTICDALIKLDYFNTDNEKDDYEGGAYPICKFIITKSFSLSELEKINSFTVVGIGAFK